MEPTDAHSRVDTWLEAHNHRDIWEWGGEWWNEAGQAFARLVRSDGQLGSSREDLPVAPPEGIDEGLLDQLTQLQASRHESDETIARLTQENCELRSRLVASTHEQDRLHVEVTKLTEALDVERLASKQLLEARDELNRVSQRLRASETKQRRLEEEISSFKASVTAEVSESAEIDRDSVSTPSDVVSDINDFQLQSSERNKAGKQILGHAVKSKKPVRTHRRNHSIGLDSGLDRAHASSENVESTLGPEVPGVSVQSPKKHTAGKGLGQEKLRPFGNSTNWKRNESP